MERCAAADLTAESAEDLDNTLNLPDGVRPIPDEEWTRLYNLYNRRAWNIQSRYTRFTKVIGKDWATLSQKESNRDLFISLVKQPTYNE